MADSEYHYDESEDYAREDSEGDGLNLAGFLFGNIDEKGELEDNEVLDEVGPYYVFQGFDDVDR